MDGHVKHVFAEPSVPPVIAVTEVGHLTSSTNLDCGMTIEIAANRPILKIFDRNGSTIEEEDFSKKDSGRKYLVMRNKRTNEISIYGSNVTYLKKPDYFKMKTFEGQTVLDKEHEFTTVFGTKKSSRISKSRKDESIVSSVDVIENITTPSSTLDSSFSQTNELLMYLPLGCNRFSNKIENVYPLSTLLHEHEIDSMTYYAQELISMLPLSSDNEDFTEFFITNINRLTHKTIQNICLLTFADGLIELLKKKKSYLNYSSVIIYPNSEEINSKILDHFVEYSVTGCDFSSKMKDKTVCHLIIIMLLINMNVIDLTWLSPFLPSSSQKRLILLMRVVGASSLKDDKTKYTLKIPLASLPTFNKQPKRKR